MHISLSDGVLPNQLSVNMDNSGLWTT